MASIKFSIITCTWNSEKYLEECLKSIVDQTLASYEIIIVDGGSTDRTLEIVRKYNISKVYTGIQGGISAAMNFGISKAEGQYISILHSDDYYASNEVLEIVDISLSSSQSKWLFGRLKRRIGDFEKPQSFHVDYSYERLLYQFFIPHPTVFVHKQLYSVVGVFDTTLKYAMDYDMMLRLGQVQDPLQLIGDIAVFREHGNSASTSNWYKAQYEAFLVQQKYSSNLLLKIKGAGYFMKNRVQRFLYSL